MSNIYQIDTSSAKVTFDEDSVTRGLAGQLKSRGITTDAGFSAAVNAMTDAQFITLMRAIVKSLIAVNPPSP